MPVLVAYASKHGSTRGIAERIAVILRAGGLEAAAAEDAGEPAGYDAFVIGSAVYASRWMAPAAEFIRTNGAFLTGPLVRLFSVGPVGRRIPLPAPLPPVLAALGDSIGARDHHVFRGAIDASKPRRAASLSPSARTTARVARARESCSNHRMAIRRECRAQNGVGHAAGHVAAEDVMATVTRAAAGHAIS